MNPTTITKAALLITLAGSAQTHAQLFPASFNLSTLNGTNGFVLNGADSGDRIGESVSSAGDVNGDGINDLIFGARFADPPGNGNAGQSFVVFGGAGIGTTGTIELSALNGANGFVINGIDTSDSSGFSVSSAGDVNGDGLDDLIIGASSADPNGSSSGESYVVFGGPGLGSMGTIELSALNGANGFVLSGIDNYDNSGGSVSSAGDVNGDGVDDLIIGAAGADPNGNNSAGESYVVFGGADVGSTGTIELSALNGSDGFVINGIDAGDTSGDSVSSAGDVNGDGIDDLIIGAPTADPNGTDRAGESYVVFGGADVGSTGTIELSTLNGSNGFVLSGIDDYDNSGRSVSSAGDLNGDGVDDLIIGASGAAPNGSFSGESYVVFGVFGNQWSSPVNGAFDTDANWLGGTTPVGGPVFIEPQFGVTVTGPSGALFIDALTLGADFGRTDLAMQPASLVSIDSTLQIPGSAAITGSGTLASSGTILLDGLIEMNQMVVLPGSGLVVEQTGRLEVIDGLVGTNIDNNGEISLDALTGSQSFSRFEVLDGGVYNGPDGRVFVYGDAIVRVDANHELQNDGFLSYVASDANVYGTIENQSQGVLSASLLSNITIIDDLFNSGSAIIEMGSTLTIIGSLNGSGVSGAGTVFIAGDFNPAFNLATGTTNFGGNLSLGTNSNTSIELAGAGDSDQITSLATINIAGDLTVTLIDGYTPEANDTFTLISASNINGAFAAESLPALAPGLTWDVNYTPTALTLTVLGDTCAPDFNTDGIVSSADLAILLAAWNNPGADLTGDNTTNSADLAILLAAWGSCN